MLCWTTRHSQSSVSLSGSTCVCRITEFILSEHSMTGVPPFIEVKSREWENLRRNLLRMHLDRSFVIPHNLSEYIQHLLDVIAENLRTLRARIVATEANSGCIKPFKGQTWLYGRHGCLGFKTIWAANWTPEPGHPCVPWPEVGEFQEEGDYRCSSQYGRFLPLLRWPGDPSKIRLLFVEYEFDKVRWTPLYEPPLDVNGVPYDDQADTWGEVMAFHLQDENAVEPDAHKVSVYKQFLESFGSQIHDRTIPWTTSLQPWSRVESSCALVRTVIDKHEPMLYKVLRSWSRPTAWIGFIDY